MASNHNNSAFFQITTRDGFHSPHRRFNLGYISDTLSSTMATDYNQLFINKILSVHEIDEENGWLEYDIGGGRFLTITMINGVCSFQEEYGEGDIVRGELEIYDNEYYDQNIYDAWENYFNSYDTEANSETYEGLIVVDEDVPPPYEENDMNSNNYQ